MCCEISSFGLCGRFEPGCKIARNIKQLRRLSDEEDRRNQRSASAMMRPLSRPAHPPGHPPAKDDERQGPLLGLPGPGDGGLPRRAHRRGARLARRSAEGPPRTAPRPTTVAARSCGTRARSTRRSPSSSCAIAADPKFVTAHLNRAELLIEELGEFEQAIAHCDHLLSGDPTCRAPIAAPKPRSTTSSPRRSSISTISRARCSWCGARCKTAGERGVYRAFEGQILFELGRFEEAAPAARARRVARPRVRPRALPPRSRSRAARARPRSPRAPSHGRTRSMPTTTRFPRRSPRKPSSAPPPTAIDDLPRSIREDVEGVPLLIEDFPSEELLEHERRLAADPRHLHRRSAHRGGRHRPAARPRPDDPLQEATSRRSAATRRSWSSRSRVTVTHEIGHYLGLDEDDLERLGLA